jgi:hypothetical protein
MIVSWKWLAEYVTLNATHEEFARRMMLAGFNHEETVAIGNDWAIDLEIIAHGDKHTLIAVNFMV